MFASLSCKSKPVSTIRNATRRTQLGIENLEDRTVPSTLLGDVGPAAEGPSLLGGLRGGVVLGVSPVDQVEVLGGALGGVTMRAGSGWMLDQVETLGGARGGIVMGAGSGSDANAMAHASAFAEAGNASGAGEIELFVRHIGEEIPQ